MTMPLRPSNIDKKITESFIPTLNEYIAVFNDWRSLDSPKLINRVRNILRAIKKTKWSRPEIAEEMKKATESLRAKLVTLAGKDGLAKFDSEMATEGGDDTEDDGNELNLNKYLDMTKDAQIHEVLINPTLQFSAMIYDEPKALRETTWYNIRDDMSLQRPCMNNVFKVLVDFSRRAIWKGDLQTQLTNLMDVEHIRTQVYLYFLLLSVYFYLKKIIHV